MPVAKDPNSQEFYVYHLTVAGIPFGRSARASDRVRYVRYLLGRESQRKPVKWSLSGQVVAGLLDAGCDVAVTYIAYGLTRSAALAAERDEIMRLVATGHALANIQHNPARPPKPQQVIDAVLASLREHGTW